MGFGLANATAERIVAGGKSIEVVLSDGVVVGLSKGARGAGGLAVDVDAYADARLRDSAVKRDT